MVYDRTHTRDLADLQKMNLSRRCHSRQQRLRSAAWLRWPAGVQRFVAEMQVLIGAWQAFPTLAVLAGLGILVTCLQPPRLAKRILWRAARPERGHSCPPAAPDHPADRNVRAPLEPISTPERIGAVILIGTSLVIGLWPRLLWI